MIRVKKIAHASYEMPDLDQQTEYYTDILGMTLVGQGEGRGLSRQHGRSSLGGVAQGRRRRNARASASSSAPTTISTLSRSRCTAHGIKTAAQEGS